MHQRLTCPGCGTQITADQQFCGICGTKLSGVAQKQEAVCPGCGSPITSGQSFCGVCGTKMTAGDVGQAKTQPADDVSPEKSETPPVEVKTPPVITRVPPASARGSTAVDHTAQTAEMPPSGVSEAPAMYASQPIEQDISFAGRGEQMIERTGPSQRRYGILRVAAVIFQIFGWIILVGGILASIAMAVFAAIGGSFITMFGGQSLAGTTAIGIAVGGIVVSLLYGFGLLAFAGICNILIDLARYPR